MLEGSIYCNMNVGMCNLGLLKKSEVRHASTPLSTRLRGDKAKMYINTSSRSSNQVVRFNSTLSFETQLGNDLTITRK